MVPSGSLVQLRALRKSYREGEVTRVVFERLALELGRGECVTLLGRSGSGKSTLLNLIAGIDLPDAGEVWIDGRLVSAMDERERTRFRRRHVGFVFQFFNLIPTLTVEENLLLALELNRLDDAAHRRRAMALLAQIGLGERRRSFPEQLSGGEQQRLAVARALVHDPLLLLADEPTGNLDADTGNRVLELLLDLPRRSGTTLLLVSHSRALAARADRVLRLEAGRIDPAA